MMSKMNLHTFAAAAVCSLATARAYAASTTSHSNLVEHESTPTLPKHWSFHSEAHDDEPINLSIVLKEPHQNYLSIAEAVSNPSSPEYGKYLSAEELRRTLPDLSPAARDVSAWLSGEGALDVAHEGESVAFASTVGQVRDMFNATFGWYSYFDDQPVLRTQSYRVPAHLQSVVDFLLPATQFLPTKRINTDGLDKRQHIPPAGGVNCTGNTCPRSLAQKYNINYRPTDNKSGSRIGIGGFLEQYGYQGDVTSFLKQFGLNTTVPKGYNFTFQSINGGKPASANGTDAGLEAQLDLEYSMVFAQPLQVTYYSTAGRPPTLNPFGNASIPQSKSQNEPYIQFLQYLLNQTSPPQVISISYTDDEQTVPRAYATRVCNLFARLAARGVSVLIASGDGGSVGTSENDCYGPDGKKRFIPTFPPSCPWVTSVGATASYGGAASYSGGGFSNYFGRPSWQDAAVSSYLKLLGTKHKGYYNASGRGSPDVALLGDNYVVVAGNYTSTAKGTSASTPVLAAMIALVNDLRLRAGKPVLGFLNPLLYSANLSSVYADVVKGQTNGCADSNNFEPGWEAVKGWDPTTGLGEVDFAKLRGAST